MHWLLYAFSDAIDCPQIHLPVFWIPAIPAGMTMLAGSFQSQRPVIPAGIAGQIGRIADLHGSAAQRVRDMDVPNAFSFQTFWGLSKGMASFSLRWAL